MPPIFLMFAPCDNVLVSEGNPSLITIMNELTLDPGEPIPDPVPENTVFPMRWFAFSQWELRPDEVGHTFEQRIVLQDVQQGSKLEGIAQFTQEAGKIVQRIIARLDHFPMVPTGDYRFLIFIREFGQEQWNEVGSYPFRIVMRDFRGAPAPPPRP